MAIVHSHDPEIGMTHVACTGPLRAAELARHWAEIYSDPVVLDAGRVFVDLRACDIDFTGAELLELAGRDWPQGQTANLRLAVLVATPEQFDAARQFQLLARSDAQHHVFFNEDEAIDWLLSDRE